MLGTLRTFAQARQHHPASRRRLHAHALNGGAALRDCDAQRSHQVGQPLAARGAQAAADGSGAIVGQGAIRSLLLKQIRVGDLNGVVRWMAGGVGLGGRAGGVWCMLQCRRCVACMQRDASRTCSASPSTHQVAEGGGGLQLAKQQGIASGVQVSADVDANVGACAEGQSGRAGQLSRGTLPGWPLRATPPPSPAPQLSSQAQPTGTARTRGLEHGQALARLCPLRAGQHHLHAGVAHQHPAAHQALPAGAGAALGAGALPVGGGQPHALHHHGRAQAKLHPRQVGGRGLRAAAGGVEVAAGRVERRARAWEVEAEGSSVSMQSALPSAAPPAACSSCRASGNPAIFFSPSPPSDMEAREASSGIQEKPSVVLHSKALERMATVVLRPVMLSPGIGTAGPGGTARARGGDNSRLLG